MIEVDPPPCLPEHTTDSFFEEFWRVASLPLRILLKKVPRHTRMQDFWSTCSQAERLEIAAIAWPPVTTRYNEEEEGTKQ